MSSSSFFLKSQPKQGKKRKFPTKNPSSRKSEQPKDAVADNNEEIPSSDEDEEVNDRNDLQFTDEEDNVETPQDKRLKLAKLYLEEIQKEEQSRTEDKELHQNVAQRLTNEYLDSVGKLRHKIADDFGAVDTERILTLKHKFHKLPVTCVCLTANNKFLFTGDKSNIVLKWDLETMKVVGRIDCKTGQEKSNGTAHDKKPRRPQIWVLALSSDAKFLALSDMSPYIQIWCAEKLVHLHTFSGHRDLVTGLVFRKETHDLYSASRDRSVKIWTVDEMAYVETLYGHQSAITGIDALARERAVTSGGSDCSIRIWKITEESQLIYNGHRGSIESVKLINEENFLSCGDDGSLCLWSAMKKKPLCVKTLAHGVSAENNEPNWISAIATVTNADIIASAASATSTVSGSCDGSIKIWKLSENSRDLILLFEVPVQGFVNSLAFTNDGSKLIAAIGQEHRLGRWWRIKEAKNSILVIPLMKK